MARLDDTQEPNWAEIIGPIARELLGEPNRHLSTQKELRFGRKGSLSVDLPKARWFDHEGGEGGGVLDLICREIGGDAKAAWQWLADRGYIGASVARLPATRKAKPKAAPAPKELDPETAEKSALAARQWAEAVPIEGTPGELYLRGRGLDRWPASVRWCPAFQAFPDDPHPRPAIVFPVTDDAGAVIAVQAVRLTAEGRKIASRAKTSLALRVTCVYSREYGECTELGEQCIEVQQATMSNQEGRGSPEQRSGKSDNGARQALEQEVGAADQQGVGQHWPNAHPGEEH